MGVLRMLAAERCKSGSGWVDRERSLSELMISGKHLKVAVCTGCAVSAPTLGSPMVCGSSSEGIDGYGSELTGGRSHARLARRPRGLDRFLGQCGAPAGLAGLVVWLRRDAVVSNRHRRSELDIVRAPCRDSTDRPW